MVGMKGYELTKKPTASENALLKKAAADVHRHTADSMASYDPTGARMVRREADEMEKAATESLALLETPLVGTGGELHLSQEQAYKLPGLADTVENPDGVTVQASYQRLNLAEDANCMSLAADMAETIQAQNSMEKSLAHQMAGLHSTAMKMLSSAENEMAKIGNYQGNQAQVETARLANTAARLMRAYQESMLTLHKIRTGGRQTMVVQHVHVTDGGQAVVAGSVNKGAKGGNTINGK